MASFTLNTSRLGTTTLGTASTSTAIAGQFREIEIRLAQGTVGVDMLPRFLELHLTFNGVNDEVVS